MTSDMNMRPEGDEVELREESESRLQVRGSSLLLSGRLLSSAIAYATQILIIRYLSKSDYGAFAYALSIVAVIQAAIQLGLDRGLSRYLPIYDEEAETGSIIGAIGFVVALTTSLGILTVIGFWISRSIIEGRLIEDPVAVSVLAILIALAPIEALDNLLVTVLAAFKMTGAIFLRRHVVAPLLRLVVVAVLLWTASSVEFLAVGYTIAGLLGLVIFASVLVRYLRSRRSRHPESALRFPARELLMFSLPLLTTDLVFMVINASDAIMLEWFGTTTDVAALRAVQPTAKLTQLVLSAFGILYVPFVARLYARGRHDEVGRRYWDTVNWVVVLSLPVLLLCLMFPHELTSRLLGGEYADSAALLGLLSGGYFIHAMFGFNGMTLNVYRLVRFLVWVNLSAVVVNIALNLALIPPFGPFGAAIATAGTFLIHNAAKQVGIHRRAGLRGASPETWRLYGLASGFAVAAAVVGYGTSMSLALRVALWVASGLITLAVARRTLRIEDAFPGVSRIPFVKYLFR